MQDYGYGFSQGETRMWWEGQGSITSSQTDRKFSKMTRSTVSHTGGDYWNSTVYDPKGDVLICVLKLAKNIWLTVVKS